MSRATNQQIAEGFSQGLQNFVKGYTERKAKEQETSRVKDLMNRLADPKTTDMEKVAIYGKIDPKLALGFQIANDKNKQKQQTQQFIAEHYAQDFGGAPPPSDNQNYEGAGLGGPQAKVTQPLNPGDATATQTGFTPGAPNRAAQDATQLNRNAPFSKDFTAQPLTQVPQGTAPPQQTQQPPKQQLTPKQEAQRLRAKGAALEGLQHGAGKGYFDSAKAIENEVKDKRKAFADDRKFALATNKDYMTRVNDLKTAMPLKSQALSMAEAAVMSGKVGPWSGNNLAKITGIDAFQDASGASLNLAIKQNLLGTLSQVSARATNKWLEQVALNAFAGVGKPEEANQTILEALKTEHELSEAEIAVRDQVLAQDVTESGAEQPYLQQRVNKILDPIQKEILQKGSYKTRVIYEKAEGYDHLLHNWNKPVPKGTPLTPQMGIILLQKTGDKEKAGEYAKQLGYSIYSANKIREYEQ